MGSAGCEMGGYELDEESDQSPTSALGVLENCAQANGLLSSMYPPCPPPTTCGTSTYQPSGPPFTGRTPVEAVVRTERYFRSMFTICVKIMMEV